jgi:hypothetical protein
MMAPDDHARTRDSRHCLTRSVSCPVCGVSAILAVMVDSEPDVAPNDVGFTCPNLCRPTEAQLALAVDEVPHQAAE